MLPFRRITLLMGLAPGEDFAVADRMQAEGAGRIGWAVRTVAPRAPWQSTCLAQALAGALLTGTAGRERYAAIAAFSWRAVHCSTATTDMVVRMTGEQPGEGAGLSIMYPQIPQSS